jgi:hypothetical protein
MKHNHREFYRLLEALSKTAGVPKADLKTDLVNEFTDKRTEHLHEMDDIEFSLMMGAMAAQIEENKDKTGDIWRKRVMASIGGWLNMTSPEQEAQNRAALIKGIACKSAGGGIKDFNKIPVSKLRAIYYEFLEKQKIKKNVSKL